MNKTLDFHDLEKVYDLLANGIDAVDPDKESLFLSKVCIILAHHIDDYGLIERSIQVAGKNME